MVAKEIKGFHIIQLRLPDSSGTHYTYFRKHEAKGGQQAAQAISGRLIFLYNVPVETDTSTLKKYFQQVAIGANVESYIESDLTNLDEDLFINLSQLTSVLEYKDDKDHSGISLKLPKHCGIVTFIDKAALQLAFNSLKKFSLERKALNWPSRRLGSQFLLQKVRNQIWDSGELARSVAAALEDFNRAEQELREELKRQTQLVDDDGFTMVVGAHRKTKAGILGKQRFAQTVLADQAKNKLKKKEKEDFYRFQLREKKKAEMTELLQKFKQDQEKVLAMREKKRFRPY